jgi:hypothetical protein
MGNTKKLNPSTTSTYAARRLFSLRSSSNFAGDAHIRRSTVSCGRDIPYFQILGHLETKPVGEQEHNIFIVDNVADAMLGKYFDKLWDKIHDQKYGETTEYVCPTASAVLEA